MRRGLNRTARTRKSIHVDLKHLPQQELNLTVETPMVCIRALNEEFVEFGWKTQCEALRVRHDTIMVSY